MLVHPQGSLADGKSHPSHLEGKVAIFGAQAEKPRWKLEREVFIVGLLSSHDLSLVQPSLTYAIKVLFKLDPGTLSRLLGNY